MSKGITSSPIETALERVAWVANPCAPTNEGGLPYATHSGIWEFMGKQIKVYRLNNGKAIIDADDFWKILGIDDSQSRSPHEGEKP